MISTVILVLTAVAIPALATVVDRLLKHRWKDARTREHKLARRCLITLSVLSVFGVVIVAIIEKVRAERQSQRLTQELQEAKQARQEAENDRKAHAFEGRFEAQPGQLKIFLIGDSQSSFFIMDTNNTVSLLDALFKDNLMHKFAEQNSISSKTQPGELLVSARIRGRDGLVAEIIDNEWKVIPPPKTWDRNYSTNALEVKDADGNIVFQIKLDAGVAGFDGQSVVRFQGIFFDSDGNGIALIADESNRGFSFDFRPTNSTAPFPKIKPLFKYPSSLHLGVLAD